MKKILSIILAILMVVTMLPMAVLPAGAALTPTAKGGCNGDHSGYTLLESNLEITEPGYYYINSNWYSTTYGSTLVIECSGTVTVCLNGYDLYHKGYGSRVVYLSPNGGELTVNLCDCKGTGEFYHEKGNSGIDFTPGVITLNMYGGTIRDCNSGISTWRNSTVNMYGGTIKNCSYYGIFQNDLSCKVNIYGGSIINNTEGIRVCSADSVTLTGSPVISGNTNGDLYYRIPNSAVIAKDLSVSSPITIGQDREAAGDYAVVKVDSADMLGSFKYINNTKQLFYNNNQIFVHGDSHSFKDATCAAPKTCTICGATEGVADNTTHIWGEGVLTRPTKTEEGYYTYTCSACGDTKTEVTQRAANYAEYTKALNDLRAYLDSDKLTDDVKASVAEWLEIYDSDEAYKFIAGEEETVNLYIEVALQYSAEIEAAIQDCLAGNHSGNDEYCDICGAALHICDFSGEWKYDSEKHWKECECGKTEEAAHSYIDGVCGCGYECSHSWNEGVFTKPTAKEEGCYTYNCTICGKEKRETVERASNYAEFIEALAKVKAYLDDKTLTDSMMEEVVAVVDFFELDENHSFIKCEEDKVSQMIEQLNAFIEVVEAGIEDGSAVKIDANKIMTEIANEWAAEIQAKDLMDDYMAFIADKKATEEAIAKEKEIIELAYSLEGSVADNAENIAKVEEALREFLADFTKCLEGTHCVKVYAVIEEAKCGVNAIEEGACWFCGEVLEREIEDTALTHSFTKYEVTEEAKCGVAGKKVAACDNGCGTTDEIVIEALSHTDADGDYICDFGCGHEIEIPVEPDAPADGEACPDCGRPAHEGGINGYICMLVTLIKLVVSLISSLQIGA